MNEVDSNMYTKEEKHYTNTKCLKTDRMDLPKKLISQQRPPKTLIGKWTKPSMWLTFEPVRLPPFSPSHSGRNLFQETRGTFMSSFRSTLTTSTAMPRGIMLDSHLKKTAISHKVVKMRDAREQQVQATQLHHDSSSSIFSRNSRKNSSAKDKGSYSLWRTFIWPMVPLHMTYLLWCQCPKWQQETSCKQCYKG